MLLSANSLNVNEESTASITVQLAGQPAIDVVVSIAKTVGDSSLSTISSLIFTSSNWNVPQTLSFSAADDFDAQNGQASYALSAQGWSGANLQVNALDNDRQLIATGDVLVDEGGFVLVGVRLAGQPDQTVVVSASISGDSDVTFTDGNSLDFSPNTWFVMKFLPIAVATDSDGIDGLANVNWSANGWPSAITQIKERDDDRAIVIIPPVVPFSGSVGNCLDHFERTRRWTLAGDFDE